MATARMGMGTAQPPLRMATALQTAMAPAMATAHSPRNPLKSILNAAGTSPQAAPTNSFSFFHFGISIRSTRPIFP
jgi:hypothetical protein